MSVITSRQCPLRENGIHALALGQSEPCSSNPCDPYCNEFVDTPEGVALPNGLTVGDGGLTLSGVASDGGVASPGLDASCPWVADAGAFATTTLTGTVYDPAGDNPIYEAFVRLANPTINITACDEGNGFGRASPVGAQGALTGPDGRFTLTDVPAGVPFDIIIESGDNNGYLAWHLNDPHIAMWVRQVTVPAIPACTTATLDPNLSRLPRNQSEGHIPPMAVMTGAGDPIECTLRKIGIDDAEFTTPSGTGSVQLYRFNGGYLPGSPAWGAIPDNGSANWYSGVNTYADVFLPCPEMSFNGSALRVSTVADGLYLLVSSGQRLFLSDYSNLNWQGSPTAPFATLTMLANLPSPSIDSSDRGGVLPASVDTSSTDGAALSQWLTTIGASATPGEIALPNYRHSLSSMIAPGVKYVYGDSTDLGHPGGGPVVNAAQTMNFWPGWSTGEVLSFGMHVSPITSPGLFPDECGAITAMTSEEQIFEFLLFKTNVCERITTPPPPPPPPPPGPKTFTRDYRSVCPLGAHVQWAFFSWQATVPAGTFVAFAAQTAPDDGAGAPGLGDRRSARGTP